VPPAAALRYNRRVLDVRSWGWGHWLFFGVGVIYLIFYFGYIKFSDVEGMVQRMALSPEQTAGVFTEGIERAEALFIMFGVVLLTPVAAFFALFTGLFVTAVVSTFLNQTARLPDATAQLVVWLGLGVLAFVYFDRWWPPTKWFVNLLALAFLVALRGVA
jgi:hypothetical protein